MSATWMIRARFRAYYPSRSRAPSTRHKARRRAVAAGGLPGRVGAGAGAQRVGAGHPAMSTLGSGDTAPAGPVPGQESQGHRAQEAQNLDREMPDYHRLNQATLMVIAAMFTPTAIEHPMSPGRRKANTVAPTMKAVVAPPARTRILLRMAPSL
jgi:hypothetical protein